MLLTSRFLKLDRVEAKRCMKVFIEFPEILSNMTLVSNLDQKTILAILYAPPEIKAEVKDRIANGEDISAAEIRRLKLANESLKKMSDASVKAQQEALKSRQLWFYSHAESYSHSSLN